ncbi:MAG: DUF3472 domain-containing protein [Ruminococcaceae bacterium]|nr:DUF3472 domain-containing protein [Oscillospiraceae bacterium]
MKNRFWKIIPALLLCLVTIANIMPSVYADGSHGFYMDCDADVVDNKADGFMMDFYSDSDEALCTYWSNANWGMYTEMTAKLLGCKELRGGGAYAGLQLRGNLSDRTGIMSLWRYEYTDKESGEEKYIYANALYGKTTTYDNEGSGTSCVMPYNWKSSQWYRQLLLCWQDEETGRTFIGTWFYDYEADKWTLFAYYNTQLIYSYIKGDIGQFLENYSESEGARYRSFRYRNIYFLSHENKNWVSSPTVKIRSDGNPKAFGEAKLGVSEDNTYVWASVDGKSPVDTDHEIKLTPTLTQDSVPHYGKPAVGSLNVRARTNENGETTEARLLWQMTANSTPQLSYAVTVTDLDGNKLKSFSGTRPEVTMVDISSIKTDAYKCELVITDVFGQTTTAEYCSPKYIESTKQQSEPEAPQIDNNTDSQNNLPMVLGGIAIGAVAVACGIAALIFILKKRSHH